MTYRKFNNWWSDVPKPYKPYYGPEAKAKRHYCKACGKELRVKKVKAFYLCSSCKEMDMKLSDKVDKILPALAKIQNEVELKKNKKGHNYKYADLSAVYEALGEQLESNNLTVVQTLDDTGTQPDQVLIITRIYHIESGQFVESRLMMLSKNPDPQGLGSAITYGRRYSLLTMFGLCPEDDDAASAMPKPQARPAAKPAQKAAAPIQAGEPESEASKTGKLIIEAYKLAGMPVEKVKEITGLNSINAAIKANDLQALEAGWEKLKAYITAKGAA